MNYEERINIVKNLPDRKGKNYKNLTFEKRAELFKESVERNMKKYNVRLTAGYINSMDDSENLIIEEIRDDKVINEVYFDTLEKSYKMLRKMKVHEIINSIHELNEDITISEFINKCIEVSKSEKYDSKIINWFVDLKLTIEDELKLYGESHNFSFKTVIHKNYIVKENDCIYVKLGTGQLKYKDVILTIFLPTEFNPKSLVIQRSFY